MTQIKGVDLSYAQGKLTKSNFDNIKASGIKFVILRIGYTGTSSRQCSIDSTFENNYANALAAGLEIGAYYYSTATNTTMAKKEADYCIAHLKGKHITFPVYIDVEDTVYQTRQSKTTLAKICNRFCKTVNAAGYTAGVYASKNWFETKIGAITEKHTKWVAQYYNKCTYKGSYDMWQYTSSGNVKGIKGRVDMNYSYKDFSIGQKDFNSKELYTSNYPGTFPTLPGRGYFRRGDKGLQVILVQKYLNWFGNYKLKLDGSYGPKTIAAVKNFQKKMKIKQDGLFGEGSLSKALYYRK